MIQGVDHVAISTDDVDRLASFYRDVIGFRQVWSHHITPDMEHAGQVMGLDEPECKIEMLQFGDFGLELFEFHHPVPRPADPARPVVNHGITHLCLAVTDIDAEHDRLTRSGMAFVGKPVSLPDGGKAIYGRDPDGNVIELLQSAG